MIITKIMARLKLSLSNNYQVVVNHQRLSRKKEDSSRAITLILLSVCVQQLKIFTRHYYAKRRFITYHHPSLSHHRPIVIRTCQKNVRLEKARSTPGFFFDDIVSLQGNTTQPVSRENTTTKAVNMSVKGAVKASQWFKIQFVWRVLCCPSFQL